MAPHACTTNSSSTDNDSSDNKHKDFSNERDSQSTSDNLSFNDEEQDILEPIAIIGYSFKLPQDALTPASFWKMLQEKRCAMTEWPEDRLNIAGFFHPDKRKMCTVCYTNFASFALSANGIASLSWGTLYDGRHSCI